MISSTGINQIGQVVNNNLVSEQILTSNQNTITFNNLDGLADGGYKLELGWIVGTTSTSLGMNINGDSTASNYLTEVLYGAVSTVNATQYTGGTVSTSYLVGANTVGALVILNLDIFVVGGFVSWIGNASSTFNGEIIYNTSTRYQLPVTNLKNFVLFGNVNGTTTSQPNCFGIGTTARLYRKKTATNALINPNQSLLLIDYTVPADTTTVTFNGLDLNLHGGYHIEMHGVFLASSRVTVNLNTFSSGYVKRLTGNGTTAGSDNGESGVPTISRNASNATRYGNGSVDLRPNYIDNLGIFCSGILLQQGDSLSTTYILLEEGLLVTTGNVTGISLTNNISSGIIKGTNIKIFKVK